MEVKINGISYFVEDLQQDDNKENLVLLHGFMGSGAVFGNIIQQLKHFCNPKTIDLLGHGKTGGASTGQRFQTQKQVDDLAFLIKKICDEPAFLHGYSMGGRLALQLALAKPTLLKGLTLESTNPGFKKQEERNERKRLDEQRAKRIEANFDTFLEEWKQLPLLSSEAGSDEDLKRYHKIQQGQNPQQMSFSLQGFGTGQMPAVALDAIKLPVLLLAGEKDEKYVKIMKRINSKIPKSRLEIIDGAKHRVHLDKPEAMSAKIKSFIRAFEKD